jgi:hypothetical protein
MEKGEDPICPACKTVFTKEHILKERMVSASVKSWAKKYLDDKRKANQAPEAPVDPVALRKKKRMAQIEKEILKKTVSLENARKNVARFEHELIVLNKEKKNIDFIYDTSEQADAAPAPATAPTKPSRKTKRKQQATDDVPDILKDMPPVPAGELARIVADAQAETQTA